MAADANDSCGVGHVYIMPKCRDMDINLGLAWLLLAELLVTCYYPLLYCHDLADKSCRLHPAAPTPAFAPGPIPSRCSARIRVMWAHCVDRMHEIWGRITVAS